MTLGSEARQGEGANEENEFVTPDRTEKNDSVPAVRSLFMLDDQMGEPTPPGPAVWGARPNVPWAHPARPRIERREPTRKKKKKG
jgi:hypothetical protein